MLQLLQPIRITKRIAVSKISKFYDPVGLFDSIKLQYKLEMRRLAGLTWDEDVTESDQQIWKDTLASLVDLIMISVSRCPIPSDAESESKI